MKIYKDFTIEYVDGDNYFVGYIEEQPDGYRRYISYTGNSLSSPYRTRKIDVNRPYQHESIARVEMAIDLYRSKFPLPTDTVQKDKPTMATKLYQITGKEEYGTFLVMNSTGHFVLEMKGTGAVQAFDPKALTEVKPYTVSYCSLNAAGNDPVHMVAKPGQFEPGDIIVLGAKKGAQGAAFYRIIEVDTKRDANTNINDLYLGKIVLVQ